PAPPAPPLPPAPESGRADGPRPSRLGGAILIAGAAALAIVLAIVLIGGGSDDKSGTGTSASTNTARTPTRPPRQATTPTTASRAPAARFVGSATLRPTLAGGSAFGAGLVQRTADGRRAIAIEATRLPANGAQDIYAVWLQGTAGSKFLGFVPRQVRAN